MSLKISLHSGDITETVVDAVVNAANSSLLGGGGVDGAIHRKGGPAILEECRKIRARQGGCPTGEAVITTAGKLLATYVIHTVGPVWQGGNNDQDRLLRNCYRNSLKLAQEQGIKTIAFPNISTGIYGFPKEQAARIAVDEVQRFSSEVVEEVRFVCYDGENFRLYQSLLAALDNE
ncbi:MAG: O-acetyl-ADP-ribose deacetylase [Bacteroidota bacterium]